MTLTERGDAALVSRHLTYAIGQDICYGKWGEGSIPVENHPVVTNAVLVARKHALNPVTGLAQQNCSKSIVK